MQTKVRLMREMGFRVSRIEEPNGEFICRVEKGEYIKRSISKVSECEAVTSAYKQFVQHIYNGGEMSVKANMDR